MNQAQFFCKTCGQLRLFQSKPINHILHLLATVFLCGLWLPFWILIALADTPIWRCSFCGFSDEQRYLANPNLRAIEAQQQVARYQERARREQELAGLSLSKRFTYFVDRNKKAIVAGGVVAGGVGIAIAGLSYVIQNVPPPTSRQTNLVDNSSRLTTNDWTKEEQLERRRFLARNLDGTGGFSVTLQGKAEDSLVFTHLMFSRETAEKVVNDSLSSVPYERAGFKTIVFQTSPRSSALRWTYDVKQRSWKSKK